MPHLLQTVLLLVFPAGVLTAALTDVTSYIIPNRLSAALALAFVPAALALGLPLGGFLTCVCVGLAGFVAGAALFGFGVLGGGDAKLGAACLLWLGAPAATVFLAVTATAGGALAVGLLMARRLPAPLAAAGPAWMGRLLRPGGDVPYGVAIAVGALAAFPLSPLARLSHAF